MADNRPSPDDLRRPGDPAPVKTPTQARGAAPAGRVRFVLAIGIVLVVVAFLFAYFGTRP